jgi:TolB-like protein/DNA-binding winged helix-turn-helix (wHTH) protein/Tfp pilus assembly protein PilF
VIQSAFVYRFGIFEANPRTGELLKKGVRVGLQDRPFHLLLILLRAEGKVVTREDLRSRLWPEGTFVEFDDSLNAAVKKLRVALNDSAEHPRFLETVPKVGYRFVAPVSATPEMAAGTALGPSAPEEPLRSTPVFQGGPGPTSVEAATESSGARPSPLPRPDSQVFSDRSKRLQIVAATCVLLAFTVLAVTYSLRKSPSEPQVHSIAVLPLENMSEDPQQQYFADGMTDELITDLAKLSSLSVISRTSAMQYRGTKKSLPVIGRELNVDAIVEGSIIRASDTVRISIQLINARNDRHLWAESYEQRAGNLVQLESEVAEAIADQIQIKLTSAEKQRISRARPVKPEAHEAYLKGLYFWNERTAASLKISIGYFEEAIRKDPSYALAYSGLADAYDVASDYDLLPPRDSYSKAKVAVLKALELDPTLAQAHATLADMKSAYEWDWAGAETEFKRALALNPGYATAHHWYAQHLIARGRHQEALAEIGRAMELDPLSPSINAFAGSALYMARQYDRSAEQLTKITAAEPTYAAAHYFLGFTREKQGDLKEAVKEFQRAVDLSGGDSSYLAALAHGYALSGNLHQARAICSTLQKRASREYVSSYDIALVYVGLNQKEEGLNWLNRAYEEDDPNMNFLNVDPALDDLRMDHRFENLLQRIGLTQ